ncbi:glutamine synthetase [Terfezia boudieri ATCC MYA-4762]|uniref:Glutamine synthetase n=1 Tax=Terfezia boudieri ATCC MYA-4762 TaxID=1051890 RepID=A0A3N4M125_9PEZI|nr:glutamine synthetase [Terfezia boudieri ATCC MYA-4762]
MWTVDKIKSEVLYDDKIKVAGFDVDGILRGKIISQKKFLSVLEGGFGFCSVIFGWDMHDKTYFKELTVSNAGNGYRDIIAKVDITSYRRIPWEVESFPPNSPFSSERQRIPFFLVHFLDPDTMEPIAPCPRGFLKKALKQVTHMGWKAMAGAEYEFYNFSSPPSPSDGVSYNPHLVPPNPAQMPHLTPGMFGYSVTRPVHNQDWYYAVWENCKKFRVDIEGWHTESGPGVYEAALEYQEADEMADRAGLFKYVVKSTSTKFGITPCFMAKPREGLPGNSGHMHISLIDAETSQNLFAADKPNPNAAYPDLAYLTPLAIHFLAGILHGLPDIMPLLAPTINSYKRLVENFWAPVTVSWGLEHRSASIRLISPPVSLPKATRLEIRTPGADANPHFVLGAILALGMYGVEYKLELPVPPLKRGEDTNNANPGERLPASLKEATARFIAEGSMARKVFGNEFVDHFGGTRTHEVKLWDEAVTEWEIKRYIETV